MKNELDVVKAPKETDSWKAVLSAFKEDMPSQCEACGSEVEVVVNPITLTVITYCPGCHEREEREKRSARMEAFRKEVAAKADIYLRTRGVPRRFLNARLTDFPAKWRRIGESREGLFLTGGRGVGKTHLAVALMRQMILEARPVDRSVAFRVDIQRMPLFISVPHRTSASRRYGRSSTTG